MNSDEMTRRLDELDAQLCLLLAEREKLINTGERQDTADERGENLPDRRRLAAVRRIGRRFGRTVAEAYSSVLHSFGEKPEGDARIIDITRELLSAPLYPGDPSPSMEPVVSIAGGGDCNVSRLIMGTHTGTHMDAPRHYIEGAGDIPSISSGILMGECTVADTEIFSGGELLLGCERLLLKTRDEFTGEFAREIVRAGVKLVGVEGTSVGGAEVHRTLLGAGVVIVESLDLGDAQPGEYTLFCAPLKIAGADGSPCRAFLIK